MQTKKRVFLLGGNDLEMDTIRGLLILTGQQFYDKGLAWGAKASDYAEELGNLLEWDVIPVLVELTVDRPLPEGTIVIDHHGDRAGEDASILQVMKLLGMTPERHHLLVAANDSGYIPAMQAFGATPEEIENIRWLDRKAQGVMPGMEHDAVKAVRSRRTLCGVHIVELPSYNKPGTVTDRLFSSWEDGKENLIVVIPKDANEALHEVCYEVYYFGRGDICLELKNHFALAGNPGNSWGGGKGFGNKGGNGFSGCLSMDPQDVIDFVVTRQ